MLGAVVAVKVPVLTSSGKNEKFNRRGNSNKEENNYEKSIKIKGILYKTAQDLEFNCVV